MRHGIKRRKLNRTSSHRKAMLVNMAAALIEHEQIETTLPKAKELRPYVEKLITLGKKPSLESRRKLIALVGNNEMAEKILSNLSVRYNTRNGGYIRIMKFGFRYGDCAPKAIIEFVDRDVEAKGAKQIALANEARKEQLAA